MEAESNNKIIFKAKKGLKSNLSIPLRKSTVRFPREGEVNFDNSVQRLTINGHTVNRSTDLIKLEKRH